MRTEPKTFAFLVSSYRNTSAATLMMISWIHAYFSSHASVLKLLLLKKSQHNLQIHVNADCCLSSHRTTSTTALAFLCSVLINAAPQTLHVRIWQTTWRRAVAARWSFAPSRRPAANTEWVLCCNFTAFSMCCLMQFSFLHTCKKKKSVSVKKFFEAYSRRLFLRMGCLLWDIIFSSFWDQGSLGK